METKEKTANLVLVLSDIALAAWEAVILIRDAWSMGPDSGITIASVLPGVAVWLMLRAFLGLYPGHGLNAVEELRRQTYATLGTLTTIATAAVVLHVGNTMSRSVLGVGSWRSCCSPPRPTVHEMVAYAGGAVGQAGRGL